MFGLRGWVPVALTLFASTGCAEQRAVEPEPASPAPAQVVSVEAMPPAEFPTDSRLGPPGESETVAPLWRRGEPVPDLWLRPELATERAPDRFIAVFDTTKGEFVVRVERDWAPQGADRFFNLVRIGFYTDIAVFRAIPGFMVQFGIHGVPEVNAAWKDARIPDDTTHESNVRGTVVFAMAGPGTRTVQLFVNTVDNSRLDNMGFTPLGEVVQGMDVVDSLYTGYGEGEPRGKGPSQSELQTRGNDYVRAGFPELDYIKTVRLAPGN